MRDRVLEIEQEMSAPGFWDDRKKSEQFSRELQHKKRILNTYDVLYRELDDLKDIDVMIEEDPEALSPEEFGVSMQKLSGDISSFRSLLFLDGPYDSCDAILAIHAGTGGKDAQDFVSMLLRMYLRFFEQNDFRATILDKSEGEEVGIKNVTVEVTGSMAYGLLKSEHGVHRLVRLSPFNAKNSRETSFVMVEVLPVVSEEDFQINEKDLRVDTFRAGGKGGQGVNTTDSAVRITHVPTSTVVQCQNERSQLQNKEAAMKVLIAKLIELQNEQKVATLNDLKGKKREISWGNQIRSYVLQPYTLVKDHRTGEETSQAQKVLDGHIGGFIQAYLLKKS